MQNSVDLGEREARNILKQIDIAGKRRNGIHTMCIVSIATILTRLSGRIMSLGW